MQPCKSQKLTGVLRAAMLLAPLALTAYASDALAVQSFADVKTRYVSSESTLLDRHGVPIETLRTDLSVRRLDWVALGDVSPALVSALILSEDKRFYQHSGIDWSAAGSAAWNNFTGAHLRGASTITMQLAGLLDPDLQSRTGRSVIQKIDQAATALAIERSWQKKQILEAYLNLVGFRGELQGIGALSGSLFEKLPSGIDSREAALAVALIRSPNATSTRVAQRACAILKEEQLPALCEGLDDYAFSILARRGVAPVMQSVELAPHLAHRLLKAGAGTTVRSTLDASLQRVANEALRQQMAELSGRNVGDGAVIVLDNASGDVLAYVGSSGHYSSSAAVDNVTAPRQAGSTLKPFLYELAIERRWLTAASLLNDAPLDLKTTGGLYIPQDYDHDFKGMVSLRTALGSSLNVPAVKTIVLVTPDAFAERLGKLGFPLKETGDYYGYSLALGSSEVSLLNLTNAYRTLANRGRASAIRTIDVKGAPQSDAHQVLDPAATFVVSDILADRNARATTFGLGNVLDTRYWSAVKTGTSKDMRDNWCVGYTQRYTVGVWVGNDNGKPMWDVSGVTGAAPIWHQVMDYLHNQDVVDLAKTTVPDGTVLRHITFAGSTEPERDEWFLAGTETTRIEKAPAARSATRMIAQPADGSIVALDPDIPAAAQKLRIRAVALLDAHILWRMDGKPLGHQSSMDWALWPGSHHLELVDAKGQVIDQLHFEVRGARVKDAKAT